MADVRPNAAGCEQAAQVLEEFVPAGEFETILLVTHQAKMADLVGRVVFVDKALNGMSTLVQNSAGSPEPLPSRGDPAEIQEALRAALKVVADA